MEQMGRVDFVAEVIDCCDIGEVASVVFCGGRTFRARTHDGVHFMTSRDQHRHDGLSDKAVRPRYENT